MIYPIKWNAIIREKLKWLLGKSLTKECAIHLYSLAGYFLLVSGQDRWEWSDATNVSEGPYTSGYSNEEIYGQERNNAETKIEEVEFNVFWVTSGSKVGRDQVPFFFFPLLSLPCHRHWICDLLVLFRSNCQRSLLYSLFWAPIFRSWEGIILQEYILCILLIFCQSRKLENVVSGYLYLNMWDFKFHLSGDPRSEPPCYALRALLWYR